MTASQSFEYVDTYCGVRLAYFPMSRSPADGKGRRILTSLEVCAGAGGQARGLEMAGFNHVALVESDPHACATLRMNRPYWNTVQVDVMDFGALRYRSMGAPGGREVPLDLLAGGVPCPPFSVAGKMLGVSDPRNLFGQMIRLAEEADPKAVMIENVRGLLRPEFDMYRHEIESAFIDLGFKSQGFRLVHSSDHGVPQLRPRVIFVGLKPPYDASFDWPSDVTPARTVGESLLDLMSENGWEGARDWARKANAIAPTLVGGSKLHGGPDLGPSRARAAWASLGVDGSLIADEAPKRGFVGMPNLTVAMAAIIQGFEPEWKIAGTKTHAYRQVGNAFPPPVARAIGAAIRTAIIQHDG